MSDRVPLLVADDPPLFREAIVRAVGERPDLELVGEAKDGRAALGAIRERAARRGGFQWTVAITGEVPPERERLVFSLVRELLADAARHARAGQVDVRVEASAEALRISVADDGAGIADGRLDHAVRDGHIGLASSFERVEALDGRLDVVSEAGAGTRVKATIPLRAAVPA